MTKELKLNKNTKIFLFFITLISVVLIICGGRGQIFNFSTMAFWIGAGAVAESLIIILPSSFGISVGFAVSVAAIIVIGPYQAAICGALAIALRVNGVGKKETKHLFNTEAYKTIFNVSQIFISIYSSGLIYEALGGKIGITSFPQSIALIIFYSTINSSIVSMLLSFVSGKSPFSIWVDSVKGILVNTTLVGSIGILMAMVSVKMGNTAVLLFFGPLFIARYSYRQYKEMRDTYMETINAFNKALEAKDPYTSGHSLRVQQYSEKLGEALGLPSKKMMNIKTAAVLHDIGKIGVDDFILRKPGKLTKEEFDMIKKHPEIGSDILTDVDFLRNAAGIIRSHHERYDGNGYPDGIKGDEIPVESTILSIADVYDAMTSDRPYRGALSKEEALAEIKANAGIQFSPSVANKFVEIMSEER